MKIEKTAIGSYNNNSITVNVREEPFFQAPFHSHPEFELIYIKESFGKRIVGNCVANFEAGDLVFLGADIPHVWLNDESYYLDSSELRAKSVVVYFNKDIFGPSFYKLEEAQSLISFFLSASRGVSIHGQTRERIIKKLNKLIKKKDFKVIIGLLEILSLLSKSNELTYLNDHNYIPNNSNFQQDKLLQVMEYINQNYANDITLEEVAKIANLTPTSFCRSFKIKAKKSFIEYLNEKRIHNSCTYLIETDLPISEIAFICGCKTASNYNRLFKKLTGTTPKEYKKIAKIKSMPSL